MTAADQYREKAAEFAALARLNVSAAMQIEFGLMAASYLRLAESAERNAQTDLFCETPSAEQQA
jgi:hypothetical protein